MNKMVLRGQQAFQALFIAGATVMSLCASVINFAVPAGDLCPVGTYNNLTGLRAANECAPCDPGYYCPNQGIVVPDKLCSAGHYCELGSTEPAPVGQAYGYSCPVGHYCPEGTPAPVPCAAGFYQPNTGRVNVGMTCSSSNRALFTFIFYRCIMLMSDHTKTSWPL